MRTLWCWRCKMDIPMLDDDEWEILMRAQAVNSTDPACALEILRGAAAERGLPPPQPAAPDSGAIASRQWYILAGYEMFTGMRETEANAIWHHVASKYGPPARIAESRCGRRKPGSAPRAAGEWARTPRADTGIPVIL